MANQNHHQLQIDRRGLQQCIRYIKELRNYIKNEKNCCIIELRSLFGKKKSNVLEGKRIIGISEFVFTCQEMYEQLELLSGGNIAGMSQELNIAATYFKKIGRYKHSINQHLLEHGYCERIMMNQSREIKSIEFLFVH
ncbi:hypothetical protein ACFFIS_09695 [Virgibacillus soli]|uniref:Uncharacterized protein n=1 Tax=Paracerasibacillus soli TaxID=480284 RepID=A0ABU5CQ85_9BACI|nr:hypothetical protein [Virgibacillus soli]MDY0407618.1 hypothetical protein [Virgibacillus soli]